MQDKERIKRRPVDELPGSKKPVAHAPELNTTDLDDLSNLSPNDIQRLVDELRVHQIELEAENARLSKAFGEFSDKSPDLTEAAPARSLTQDSQDRFRKIFEFAPVGMALTAPDGVFLQVNRALARMLGYSRSELVGTNYKNITHPDDLGISTAQVEKLASQKKTVAYFEKRYLHRNGKTLWVLVSTFLSHDGQGNPQYFISHIQDITAQKMAQQGLEKANRALRALNECHQALIRHDDESDLIQELCRILVETGGYRLAWVGFAQYDDKKSVQPVGGWGRHYDYAKLANITWADTDQGRGPTGTAVRTGITKIERNIQESHDFAPWRDEALRRGLISSIALPLRSDQECFGALNIYSAELDAFDTEELHLLTELTDNLSYGIIAIRVRKSRELAKARLRRLNEKLQLAHYSLENTHEEIFWIDKHARIVNANKAACDRLGYTRKELLKLTIADIDPNYPVHLWQDHWNELRVKKSLFFESTHKTKHGQTIPIEASLTYFDYGGTEYNCAFVRDITERMRTEEALRESETRLRRIFEQANDGIFVISSENRYIDANPSGLQMFGYTREELLRMGVADVLVSQERHRLNTEQPLMMTGQPHLAEWVHLRKDGSTFPGEVSARVLSDQSYLAIVRDLTERKRAEQALRESEEKFSKAFQNSPDAITITAASDGRLIDINDSFTRMSGYTREEIIGKTSVELDLWSNLGDRDRYVTELRAKGRVINFETVFRTRSGEHRNFLVSGELITLYGAPFILGVIHDITERKKSDEKIKRHTLLLESLNRIQRGFLSNTDSKDLFGGLLNTVISLTESEYGFIAEVLYTPEGAPYIRNQAITDIAWDEETKELYRKYDAEGLEFHNLKTLLGKVITSEGPVISNDPHTDERSYGLPKGHPPLNSFLGLPFHYENKLIGMVAVANRSHGYDQVIVDYLEPFVSTCGNILGAFRNEQRRREAAEEIRKLNLELEQRVKDRTIALESANKELESFSYSVSHDLRAPLRAITGFSQILVSEHKKYLNDEGRHYLENIVEAGEQMDRLIRDLLEFSRLGRKAVRHQPVALDDVFVKISHTLADLIAGSNAVVAAHNELPIVIGDETLLNQVFTNLIVNALTYHRQDIPPEVKITFEKKDNAVLIRVKDNGIGIEPEFHEKIFNIFQRLHSQDDFPGTGVGLAIVQKSVELLDGKVWVESSSDHGTTFCVSLPAAH